MANNRGLKLDANKIKECTQIGKGSFGTAYKCEYDPKGDPDDPILTFCSMQVINDKNKYFFVAKIHNKPDEFEQEALATNHMALALAKNNDISEAEKKCVNLCASAEVSGKNDSVKELTNVSKFIISKLECYAAPGENTKLNEYEAQSSNASAYLTKTSITLLVTPQDQEIIAMQLVGCAALGQNAIRKAGLIHADQGARNLLVSDVIYRDGIIVGQRSKICDFGISEIVGDNEVYVKTHVKNGPIYYMNKLWLIELNKSLLGEAYGFRVMMGELLGISRGKNNIVKVQKDRTGINQALMVTDVDGEEKALKDMSETLNLKESLLTEYFVENFTCMDSIKGKDLQRTVVDELCQKDFICFLTASNNYFKRQFNIASDAYLNSAKAKDSNAIHVFLVTVNRLMGLTVSTSFAKSDLYRAVIEKLMPLGINKGEYTDKECNAIVNIITQFNKPINDDFNKPINDDFNKPINDDSFKLNTNVNDATPYQFYETKEGREFIDTPLSPISKEDDKEYAARLKRLIPKLEENQVILDNDKLRKEESKRSKQTRADSSSLFTSSSKSVTFINTPMKDIKVNEFQPLQSQFKTFFDKIIKATKTKGLLRGQKHIFLVSKKESIASLLNLKHFLENPNDERHGYLRRSMDSFKDTFIECLCAVIDESVDRQIKKTGGSNVLSILKDNIIHLPDDIKNHNEITSRLDKMNRYSKNFITRLVK